MSEIDKAMERMCVDILKEVEAKPKKGKGSATLKEKTNALKAVIDWKKLKAKEKSPGDGKNEFNSYRDRLNAASDNGTVGGGASNGTKRTTN